MAEGTDRPVGERRRRREAERAAALAAEAAGQSRPLTRRELRRLEAEEAARLEAIATGELRVGDVQAAYDAHVAATTADSAPSAASAGGDAGGVTTTADSAPSAASAGGDAGGVTTTADSAPSAASAGGDARGVTTTADSAPSAASADAPPAAGSASSAGAAPSGIPSRRSLRDRAKDAQTAPPERPQERTATGRRPVVRTPSTAQGVRSLDSTGQLTGIQPVVRPDAADRPSDPEPPAAEVDDPAPASPTPPHTDAPSGTTSESGEEVDDESDFTMRPEWVAISSISGATPDEARSDLPARRSRREHTDPDVEPEAEQGNPAVTVVKVTVLVLVAAVIGGLIWLLGTGVLDDDGAAGATAAPTLIITTPHPEETSAR